MEIFIGNYTNSPSVIILPTESRIENFHKKKHSSLISLPVALHMENTRQKNIHFIPSIIPSVQYITDRKTVCNSIGNSLGTV